jgi:hypothetical protein
MAGLLFVSQAMIDSWADQGRIDFVGNVMTLLSGEGRGRSYALDPAVRFLALLGAETDPHLLLKKVKSVAQLRELGAEVIDASVVHGDVAYEVEPGYLAEMSALQAAATAKVDPARAAAARAAPPTPSHAAALKPGIPVAPRVAPPAPPPPAPAATGRAPGAPPPVGPLPATLEARRKEAEELARFLLDKLS